MSTKKVSSCPDVASLPYAVMLLSEKIMPTYLPMADQTFCAPFEIALIASSARFFTLSHSTLVAIHSSEALHLVEHHATSSWPVNAAPTMSQIELLGLMQKS